MIKKENNYFTKRNATFSFLANIFIQRCFLQNNALPKNSKGFIVFFDISKSQKGKYKNWFNALLLNIAWTLFIFFIKKKIVGFLKHKIWQQINLQQLLEHAISRFTQANLWRTLGLSDFSDVFY